MSTNEFKHVTSSFVRETQTCDIFMGPINEIIVELLNKNFHRIVIIIDENVNNLWNQKIKEVFCIYQQITILDLIVVSSGEEAKSLSSYLDVIGKIQNIPFNRRDLLLIIGGGAICDLGGTIAATFMRGVPYILVPTTLMAIVDAAIGGKVAINLPAGKNLLGSFHTPASVWIDLMFLETLPKNEFQQAFGELIKIATISNSKSFFNKLIKFDQNINNCNSDELMQIIEYAIKYKLSLIELDWKEVDLDRYLNAGHEIAHSLEKIFNFDHSYLMHGEAVTIGIATCTRFALAKRLISFEDASQIFQLIEKFELKTHINFNDSYKEKLLSALEIQKRVRGGKLRLVLPISNCSSIIYQGSDEFEVTKYIN